MEEGLKMETVLFDGMGSALPCPAGRTSPPPPPPAILLIASLWGEAAVVLEIAVRPGALALPLFLRHFAFSRTATIDPGFVLLRCRDTLSTQLLCGP